MSRWKLMTLAALVTVTTSACSDSQTLVQPEVQPILSAALEDAGPSSPSLTIFADPVPLLADGGADGQKLVVGHVSFDETGFEIVMDGTDDAADFCLMGVKWQVYGEAPSTTSSNAWSDGKKIAKNGSPKVGQFDGNSGPLGCDYDGFSASVALTETDYVAIHAGVRKTIEIADDKVILVSSPGGSTSLDGFRTSYATPEAAGWAAWGGGVETASNPAWTAGPLESGQDWIAPGGTYDRSVDSWWLFRDGFAIPEGAENISGVLNASVDNALEPYFDGSPLDPDPADCNNGTIDGATSDGLGAFKTMCDYPFNAVAGTNGLDFIVRNYASTGTNPSALTYSVKVDYELYRYESAWAGVAVTDEDPASCLVDGKTAGCNGYGLDFPGRDWSMYLEVGPYLPVTYGCPAASDWTNALPISAPQSVMKGALTSDTEVQFFAESVQVLEQPQPFEVPYAETQNEVETGSLVCSYYVHADLEDDSGTRTIDGSITFDEQILGLIVSGSAYPTNGTFHDEDLVCQTNGSFGGPGTIYPSTCLGTDATWHGLELGTPSNGGATFDQGGGTNDGISLQGGTVDFDLRLAQYHDAFRILLEAVKQD